MKGTTRFLNRRNIKGKLTKLLMKLAEDQHLQELALDKLIDAALTILQNSITFILSGKVTAAVENQSATITNHEEMHHSCGERAPLLRSDGTIPASVFT